MPNCLTFSAAPKNYVPADLRHDTNGWYVVYYSFNPTVDSLERKRMRLNQLRKRCHSTNEFRLQANEIMSSINDQLRETAYTYLSLSSKPISTCEVPLLTASLPSEPEQHITPIKVPSSPTQDNVRPYTPLEKVIDLYITEKKKELKPTTLRSYSCFCKQFTEWLQKHQPNIKISEFTQTLAVEYMEFVFAGGNSDGKKQKSQRHKEDSVTPTTYNNNLKLARALFFWAIEKCYCKENPFEKLKTKKPLPKKRELIPVEDRNRIYSYFQQHNPAMCIIMQLVYVSLLRPIEITRVKVKQLDFEHHCIQMKNTQTKNGKARSGRMDAALEALLKEHIKGANPEDFLFADGIWKCGSKPMSNHSFGLTWSKMRKDLKMPEEYQFYSLRDTGINNMLEAGVSPLDAMQAAGHSDLSMTTRYANHYNKNLIDNLNQNAPSLVSTATDDSTSDN